MNTTQPINWSMPPSRSLGDMQAREAERAARVASLESELAALRQIVADVETCRDFGHGVTVYCDDDHVFESTHHSAVILLTDNIRVPFYAPTWQAALHAAAEHVRREAKEQGK